MSRASHPHTLTPPPPSPAGRLIPDSPADQCGLLYVHDELLAVNGQDVSRNDHGDIVSLIKSSPTEIHLAVRQPEGGCGFVVARFTTVPYPSDLEVFERQMVSAR